MPFDAILVCLDLVSSEEELISSAARIASRDGARLTFLHVLDERARADQAAFETKARELIASRVSPLTGEAAWDAVVRFGHPLAEILAESERHALVMTGADHNRRAGDMLFGGTTTRLLRSCRRPVLVVRSEADESGPVLAAVALRGQPETPHDPLDLVILEHAAAQAERRGGPLHLIHVAQSWVPFGSVDDDLAAQATALCEKGRARLGTLLLEAGLDLPDDHVHIKVGDPAEELFGACLALGVQLLVMGTVARTGIAGLIVGNTAEKLMRRIDSSLLALKPEGFQPRSEGLAADLA